MIKLIIKVLVSLCIEFTSESILDNTCILYESLEIIIPLNLYPLSSIVTIVFSDSLEKSGKLFSVKYWFLLIFFSSSSLYTITIKLGGIRIKSSSCIPGFP